MTGGKVKARGTGILALWNDCAPGYEARYEDWYQTEHLPERLSIPGFLLGRRYEAIDSETPRFFTYYEVTAPDILQSPAYQARLKDPTPRTREIMSNAFRNMSRTVCTREPAVPGAFGTFAVTLRSADPADRDAFLKTALRLTEPGVLARAEVWQTAERGDRWSSAEEDLRGPDQKIGACLLLEFLREDPARGAARDLPGSAVYRLIADLRTE